VRRTGVYLALLSVQLLFATAPVGVKMALRELSSPSLALLRAASATLLFLAMQRVLETERVRSRADLARLAVYGLFGVTGNQLLYITALNYTTATVAQTLVTAGPALTLLVAILLRHESASRAKWTGISLAAAGALVLVGFDLQSGAALGNLLILGNVLCFSVFLVISRDMLRRYSPLTVITWVFVFGTAGIVPFALPTLLAERGAVSPATWAILAWLVIGPTVGAYYLNHWALQRVQASTVAVFTYLQPVGTVLLAVPLLGERPSLPLLVPAAALIFLGVWIASRSGQSVEAVES
jgi:drug/metabolite transporter (DMT)-like permease